MKLINKINKIYFFLCNVLAFKQQTLYLTFLLFINCVDIPIDESRYLNAKLNSFYFFINFF